MKLVDVLSAELLVRTELSAADVLAVLEAADKQP